jgi:hypothetical protein
MIEVGFAKLGRRGDQDGMRSVDSAPVPWHEQSARTVEVLSLEHGWIISFLIQTMMTEIDFGK